MVLSSRLLLLWMLPLLALASTYYETLELKQDVPNMQVKKASRSLALRWHPDKNPDEDTTAKFQEISEAYEVLSDATKRAAYDQALRGSSGGRTWQNRQRRQRRDPFDQFNDLFQNDPFFQEAFKGMDDLFKNTFQQDRTPDTKTKPRSGFSWTTSSSTTVNGRRVSGSTTRRGAEGSTRQAKTHYENGQRVTIQSLEKDGNKIQEKYIETKLIERLINGVPEQLKLDQIDSEL
jgi:DnaJ-class molecular chaperone